MWWLLMILLLAVNVAAGIRREQQANLWSWSKFVFALTFGVLECGLVILPITYLDPAGRYYGLIYAAACAVAALNFVWFIVVMRRWRLPDGRTSLEAYRDEHSKTSGPF